MLSPIEIFCCYAHQDQPLLQRLKSHLKLLERQGLITIWSDVDIDAGVEWEQEIHTHLNSSQIVLLLVSADFMASDYCYSTEMQRAMRRHEQKEARVIPILLRPTYWKGAPFEKLQFLPTKAKPITDRSWSEDEALSDVAEQINNVVKELRLQRILRDAQRLATNLKYEEALLLYEQATSIEADSTSAFRGKGETLFVLGRYKEGLLALEQAIQIDPKIGDALFFQNKAEALKELQHYEESIAAYDEALRLKPHDARLYYNKAAILLQLKRPKEALVAYEQVISLDPNYAVYYEVKGDLLLELKRPQEALEAYGQAIKLEQDNLYCYDKQGKVLLGLKRYKEAIAVYEQALSLNPENILYHQNKGQALLALKRYEEALVDYEACIQLGTNDSYCYFGQGQALFGLERYEEALAAYKQAQVLSAPHSDPQFYHEQAVVYERLAQRIYEQEKQVKEHQKPTSKYSVYERSDWFEKKPILLRILSGNRYTLHPKMMFSPDGQVLVDGSDAEIIKLWNVQTGEVMHILSGHEYSVNETAFSPDGQLLASAGQDRTIKLWNIQTGEVMHTLLGHTSFVYGVAFSPDGQLLASGSNDNTIRLWGHA